MFITSELLRKYRQVYITTFDEGLVVPWTPLSLEDYISFTHKYYSGFLAAEIEDSIFRKCVVDDSLLRTMDFLKAGIVSTVALNIWQYSGPGGIEALSSDLDTARALNKSPLTNSFTELAKMITLAYPYKPEEVYSMPYEVFIMRAAQAEDKLLTLGMISEPITISAPEARKKEKTRTRLDAKKLWEIQEGLEEKDREAKKGPIPGPLRKKSQQRISPVLEKGAAHNIDFSSERRETEAKLTGWDRAELPVQRAKMVEDAKIIYKDLIKELAARRNKKE